MKMLYEALHLLWDEKIRTFAAIIQVMIFIVALTIAAGAFRSTIKYTALYNQYNLNDKIFFPKTWNLSRTTVKQIVHRSF